ncbi:MAG: MMPL family transporter [Flavobacteriales bacterium]|nr:MMPL family transporter [Flavobacteriales bacterium]MBL0035500.1 MMPL family transporter [Flavobacteriales bacterium]
MGKYVDRIERWLTRERARWTLIALGVITVALGISLRNVRLDYDFEKFFPTSDPELDRYLGFRERFGNDNDFLLVAAERKPSVFDQGFLLKVDSLSARLTRLTDMRSVSSPTRLEEPVITPVGVFNVPVLRVGSDSTLAADSARIWTDDRIREAYFAPAGDALLIVAQTTPDLSKKRSDDLLEGVERVMRESGLQGLHVAGRIHGQYYYIQKMERELVLFLTASILLLAVFLYFGFRSLLGVIVPIGVVGLSILWEVGAMSLFDEPLSILTMLLPTILFVVGMSDVVHLLETFLENVRAGMERRRALAVTYKEAGLPTFLTAVTSAIGFATLGSASIQPLQEFGVYTAIGVMVAFVLAFTLLPALLLFIDPRRMLPRAIESSPWDRWLPRLFRWTIRNRVRILIGFGLIMVVSTVGLSRIKVNNYLLEDWPDDDPQKQDFFYFERTFGGVRPFELELTVMDSTRTVWDLDVLKQIEAVQTFVHDEQGVRSILSPVTVMRSLNKAANGGGADMLRLPMEAEDARKLARQSEAFGGKEQLRMLVSEDGRTARLSGRKVDEGGFVHKGKNAELDRFIATHTDPKLVQFRQTGMAYLIDRNNEHLSGQLVGGMGLAILLTAAIMMWFFRDVRMVLVSLLPNLVPLLFIAGVMGFTGIDLKVSTAIIFSIAFGIAEDDTIHMLAKLRLQLLEGRSVPYALKRTYLSTGKAVSVTSLMLISGFLTLMLSDFASIFYMGLLITLTLIFAFVAELLLLPALILVMLRSTPKLRKNEAAP